MNILWVEDQVDAFEDLAGAFKDLGLNVKWVDNSDDFAREVSGNPYDIILIDIKGRTFNGIREFKEKREQIAEVPVAFLSAWLNSEDIHRALTEIDEEVYLLDKNFPSSDRDFIKDTFLSALEEILAEGSIETNKTYYETDIDPSVFSREYEYSEYLQFSPAKKSQIRDRAIEKSKDEVNELLNQGLRWFLIEEPSGMVVKSSPVPPPGFTSRAVARESHDRGVSCFVYEPYTVVEEMFDTQCDGHYSYYFTIDVKFGNWEEVDRLHFDSGAECSWFDKDFLTTRNIGFGLSPDHRRKMQTTSGIEDVSFFKDEIELLVLAQNEPERSFPTKMVVNGLERWRELTIGGVAPRQRLCDVCLRVGYCEKRVGLVGQDILRAPNPVCILLDGQSGLTSPRRPGPRKKG